jgi:NTE family protein
VRAGDDRRRMIAAHLPVRSWPAKRLEIVAVEARSGLRVTFNAASGVGLLDAVTASGALPGVFPWSRSTAHATPMAACTRRTTPTSQQATT